MGSFYSSSIQFFFWIGNFFSLTLCILKNTVITGSKSGNNDDLNKMVTNNYSIYIICLLYMSINKEENMSKQMLFWLKMLSVNHLIIIS